MNQTMPPLGCAVTVVDVDGRAVAVIDVPASPTPVGTRDGTYKRREPHQGTLGLLNEAG